MVGRAVLPGWERLTPEHQAAIDAVLAPSRGALIYDEDLLRVANLLGLSFADAERLRKAMGKGATDGPLINKLRAAALASGWKRSRDRGRPALVQFIQRYTFTKGHAVATGARSLAGCTARGSLSSSLLCRRAG